MHKKITRWIGFAFQIFTFFSLCYCHNKSTHNSVESDRQEAGPKIKNSKIVRVDRISYSNEYRYEIGIDTTFSIKQIAIKLFHITIKCNQYLLPLKYTDDSINRKEILFTETRISFFKNNRGLIKSIIINNKKIVDSIVGLDSQLAKYGVLLLGKDDIDIMNNKLVLNYSFSIPFTDLGKSIKLSFDLTTFKENIYIDP